ncbi:MAG: hypothetical protein AAGC73_08545 [Verrucomicrobiota bacterium]
MILVQGLGAQSLLTDYEFQIVNRRTHKITGKHEFYGTNMLGSEIPNNSLNRLSILSEDQYDYPKPMSGCGPTAMLNILIWYEKYGLIDSMNRDSNTKRYKQTFFREIDARLTAQAGKARDELEGTSNYDAAMVMDAIVKERSGGKLRLHTDFMTAPLKLSDMLKTMPNYRAGYLIVYPKDPRTGELLGLHAVTLIRADRAGYISVGSWGLMYRGLLKQRGQDQWLVTQQDGNTVKFKVVGMMRFIPFQPESAHASR